jgi:hypothetical protein
LTGPIRETQIWIAWIAIANRLVLYLELVVGSSAQHIRQSLASHENRECSLISIHGMLVKISGPSKIRMQGQHEEPIPSDLPEATATHLARHDIECDFVSGTSPSETRSALSAAALILN